MKSLIFTFLSLLFLVLGVTLAVQNGAQHIHVMLGRSVIPDVSMGTLLGVAFVFGFLTAFMQLLKIAFALQSRLGSDELRREKAEVSAETSSDKVKALEAKVATLEKALSQAIDAKKVGK